MAELTPKARRRALEFANKLSALAVMAPDTYSKSAVFGAVKDIRRHYGLTDLHKSEEIIRSLTLGCSTYDDLVSETKLPRSEVVRIVKTLEISRHIELRNMQRSGAGGRPVVFISLIAPASDG